MLEVMFCLITRSTSIVEFLVRVQILLVASILTSRHSFSESLFNMLKEHVNFDVAYDSLEREDESSSLCMENTRTEVLWRINSWAQDKDGLPVCWLYGPAGSGKSTIAQECDTDEPGKKLVFSHFFSWRNQDRSNMAKFFPTFAYQLAHFLPSVQQSMQAAVHDVDGRSIFTKRRRDQFMNLIIQPIQSTTRLTYPMIIVIDGLDEYDEVGGKFPLEKLIQLLVDQLPKLSFRLLFTSQPEPRIKAIFAQISASTYGIALQDFPDGSGVFNYLHSKLLEVRAKRKLPQGWPSEEVLQCLADKSNSIWIYASTLVKFVDDEYSNPR
jgi:hypothetical protein